MSLSKIYREDNCLYLTQDLSGLGTYDKAKAIVSFCDKETKLFEKEIDRAIIDIFERNGIQIPNTDKSVLKLAFDLLKSKGVEIVVKDLYKYSEEHIDSDYYEFVKYTKNHFTVMLERTYISGCRVETIQCGVQVLEKENKK